MIVDCGPSAYLLFSNLNGQPVTFSFDTVIIALGSRSNLGLKCMGTHNVVLQAGTNMLQLLQPDYVSISEYLLFGLAGLMCAGFVVYALLKNT